MLGNTALVIGGSRGLEQEKSTQDTDYPEGIKIIENVDLTSENGANALEIGLKKFASGKDGEGIVDKFDLVIYSAGLLKPDSLTKLSWKEQVDMYTTCSISPLFLIAKLVELDAFPPPSTSSSVKGAKVLFITSEGGSIKLRTKEEGGSNFGHHGSKAASNMIGKLLSFDLDKLGVTVVNIHPGFMTTEMTKGAGYDQYYETGGAVSPSVAAESLLDFTETITTELSGGFWAPRGPRDIGEAERVLGKDLPTPLELPW